MSTILTKFRSVNLNSTIYYVSSSVACQKIIQHRFFVSSSYRSQILSNSELEECYKTLKLPKNAEQEEVRSAFLKLAKKYHPDSSSPEANIEKFVSVEKAFRTLSRYNTGSSKQNDIDKIVYDIRHTAPQHRQYLSFEGVGIGTPYQRQKQWAQTRAHRAAENVLVYQFYKSYASGNALMEKGISCEKDHTIKTKYGFDRVVEDLIQEAMSKGEFENLSGKGKPLKNENRNPYVDFTTHKMNEVLISNGFTPEWITMSKDIDQEIENLKIDIKKERGKLGAYPLEPHEEIIWNEILENNRQLVTSINMKINKFNLIVPLINKQKFHVPFNEICEDILKNGDICKVIAEVNIQVVEKSTQNRKYDDFIALLFKVFADMFSFGRNKKVSN